MDESHHLRTANSRLKVGLSGSCG